MNPRKRRRLTFAAALVAAAAGGTALVLAALKDNVLYFYSPTEVAQKHVAAGVEFRIGGLVETKSVRHGPGATVHFAVTDGRMTVPVAFTGVLPSLFREGQAWWRWVRWTGATNSSPAKCSPSMTNVTCRPRWCRR